MRTQTNKFRGQDRVDKIWSAPQIVTWLAWCVIFIVLQYDRWCWLLIDRKRWLLNNLRSDGHIYWGCKLLWLRL